MPSTGASGKSGGRAAVKKTTKKRTTVRKKSTKGAGARSAKRLRVRQVRSAIGHAEKVRRTLRALGLKHHQDEVVVQDNPSIRGMLFKVQHLVSVTSEAPNG